jgi:3-methyladenine DNA glycosylase AlkD
VGEVKGQVNDAFLHRTARLLWALPEREYHYTAIELLSHYARHLSSSSLGKIEYLILHKSWWDSIDPLASLVGKALPRFPGWLDTIDTWSTHPNFWLRRTAIVYQRGYRSQTDAERLFRYCQLNAQDPEFFIRKAIGWALREYAKTDARAVRQFIEKHRATLSPLSIREASKYL